MNVIERYPIVWRNSRKGTYSYSLKSDKVNPIVKCDVVIVTMRYGNETKNDVCKKYKFFKYDELANMSVDLLGLGTRADNALKRYSIKTLGELATRMDDVPKIRNLGLKSLTEINDSLRAIYMRWMNEHHPEQVKDIDNVDYGDDANE